MPRVRRNALIIQNADGGWDFHANLDDVGGTEFLEIFSWYVDREFNRDWQAAVREHVDITKLARTEAHGVPMPCWRWLAPQPRARQVEIGRCQQ